MKPIRTELNIYWDDGVTIATKYFPSIRKAKKYIKYEGIENYRLEEKR